MLHKACRWWLIVSTMFLFFSVVPSTVSAAPVAPDDTPIPVVQETLNEWTLNEGLLYWANRCSGGEFRGDGYLRRMPANGGPIATLSTVTSSDCYTFLSMAADASGLYYYSEDGNGIYHRPVGAPYDPATLVVTTDKSPVGGSRLALDGDYIYWITYDWVAEAGELLRVHKDGTGPETVVALTKSPDDLIVVDGVVYWLDDDGLWSTNVSCGSLPCSKSLITGTRGNHLLYHEPDTSLWLYQLYWVSDADPIESIPQRIWRHACQWVPQPFPDPPTLECSTTKLYDAPSTTWDLSQLGTNGAYLFWPENKTDRTDGRLRRMPIGGGTVDDIAVNMPYIGPYLFTDNLYVYFHDVGTTNMGIYRLPFNASAIVRDLAADAIEVTQGIQNLAHDVPLVAHKTTYVRAYGLENSGPDAVAVEAYLHGTRGGSPIPGSPLHPINGTQALSTGGSYDRADRDDGWLFLLPDSWTEDGNVTLRVVVDPRSNYSDPNRSNNETSVALTFNDKAPLCTVYVPVRTHSPNYDRPSDNPNFGPMVDFAQRLWPVHDIWLYRQNEDIAELQVCWKWGFIPYPCFGPYELPSDTWKVLISLNTRDFFTDDPDACDNAGAKTHYVGMVHPETNTGSTGGSAYLNDNVTWVKFPPHTPTSPDDPFWPDKGSTLAHELAHNLGRKHVDCGGPDDIDTGYPYPSNQLDNVGASNHYAFDVKTRTPIAPDGAADLMSYCRPRWSSDYTWKALYNRISNTRARVASAAPRLAAADDAVFVSGAITPSLNTGALNYAWVYPTAQLSAGMLRKWEAVAANPMDAAGAGVNTSQAVAYHVRLLDDQDNILVDTPITPTEAIDQETAHPVRFFAVTLPSPAGSVARVELLADATVMDHRDAGASVPSVTLLEPAGGETFAEQMQLVWQASDADSDDALLYNVQYSPDNGQSWLSLLTDFPAVQNSDVSTVTLTSLGVPGSNAGEGLIRVAASDGYHTGLATSAPFTVTNRKPEPYIVSPVEGEMAPAAQPVLLQGDANDAEDGGLSGDALAWTVDGQAQGTGESLLIHGLAPGDHEVALTAHDSDAQEATAQTSFEISPLGVPQGDTPSLDGFCDDAAYFDSMQVLLAPYSDGAQAAVHLMRDSDHLWACFSGMALGSEGPGAFAGLRVDVDDSRDEFAQTDDYAFFVGEDGGYVTYAGDGAGGFTDEGPGGLQAQVSAYTYTWSAELRIEAGVLGGWDRIIGMNLGHYWVAAQGDDYEWPYQTDWNKPNTWAATALGDLPGIERLNPASATAGDPGFALTIEGENFATDATARWDAAALPTTHISSTRLTATVNAINIATAGTVEIVVRNPGGDDLDSNPVDFAVYNPVPAISSLNPNTAQAEGGAFTLTVHGSNFIDGATVLWDGVSCSTTYVSSSQLTAQIEASQIVQGGTVGVTVRNPDPGSQTSDPADFTITVQQQRRIYLPLVLRK